MFIVILGLGTTWHVQSELIRRPLLDRGHLRVLEAVCFAAVIDPEAAVQSSAFHGLFPGAKYPLIYHHHPICSGSAFITKTN